MTIQNVRIQPMPAPGGAIAPDAIRMMRDGFPLACAIEADGGMISYADLDQRAGTLAARYHDAGVCAGDLVAVLLPRSSDQIAAMLAAWWLGAAYLPLDPAWPTLRIADLVARAGCRVLVARDGEAVALPSGTCLIDVAAPGSATPPPRADTDPVSPAYVIYTSGSTGAPKGVEVSHANLAALIAWHVDAFAIGAQTRTSHLAGLGFDASAWEVWPTLAAGGTLVLADDDVRMDPTRLRDWLVANAVAVAFAPTVLAEPLARMAWPTGTRLRTLLTGADTLTVRPIHHQPFDLVNNYGPTESTVVATSGIVSPDGDGLPTIGRPIAGTTIHILDAMGAAMATGEIWIGGAQVALGYRHDRDATAERFVTHPDHGRLYRTGDLGTWCDNGEIAFLGRADAQLKIRGHRIEPAEITAALKRVAGVADGVAVARAAKGGGELVAYVIATPDTPLTAAGLRAALAQGLPDYMIPDRFALLDALPLTANGKLDAKALPDPALHPVDRAAVCRAPSTPTEQRFFEIIAEVIGRSDFGVDDDFFLLGGHSLLGTQVIVRARDAFGVELNLFHLFEGRTIAALSAKVEALVMEMLAAMSDDDIARLTAS